MALGIFVGPFRAGRRWARRAILRKPDNSSSKPRDMGKDAATTASTINRGSSTTEGTDGAKTTQGESRRGSLNPGISLHGSDTSSNFIPDTLCVADVNMDSLMGGEHSTIVRGSKFILDPRSRVMLWWMLTLLIITVYTSLVSPVEIAWYRDNVSDNAEVWLIFNNVFVTVVFAVDIVLNFNLAILSDESDTLDIKRSNIAREYMRFWFWVDVLATVPFDLITGNTNSALFRLMKLLRLGRLAKMLSSKNVMRTLEEERAVNYDSLYLSKFGGLLMLMMHLMACGLFIIAQFSGGANNSDVGNFIENNGLEDFSVFDQWLYGFYWAAMTVSTIGYGDVGLVNNAERGYATVCMLIGASIYAYMVGALIGVILNMDQAENERRDMLSDMNEMMKSVNIPEKKQQRVRTFFAKTTASESKSISHYEDSLRRLSPPLAAMLIRHMHRLWLPQVNWLNSADNSFIIELAFLLKEQTFSPNEMIFRSDSHANNMYIVRSGLIATSRKHPILPGNIVGEEIVLKRHETYGYFVMAETYVNTLVLSRVDLQNLLGLHPSMKARVRWAEISCYITRNSVALKVISKDTEAKEESKVPNDTVHETYNGSTKRSPYATVFEHKTPEELAQPKAAVPEVVGKELLLEGLLKDVATSVEAVHKRLDALEMMNGNGNTSTTPIYEHTAFQE